jgi:ABC-type uncharacterized transport system substrate-binding protein
MAIHIARREFIVGIGGVVAWPLAARGQTNTKIPRIGVLWHEPSAEDAATYLSAVRQGMSDFGYAEGQNIILENRFAAETPERFSSLAAELAALNVNVLVAVTRIAALAAQRATTTIPIVFVAIPDPVGSKLVASLAHPGGNITGLSNFAHDLTAKRVEFLKTIVPSVSRVALLMNPNDRDSARIYVEEGQAAADKLDLMLVNVRFYSDSDRIAASRQPPRPARPLFRSVIFSPVVTPFWAGANGNRHRTAAIHIRTRRHGGRMAARGGGATGRADAPRWSIGSVPSKRR